MGACMVDEECGGGPNNKTAAGCTVLYNVMRTLDNRSIVLYTVYYGTPSCQVVQYDNSSTFCNAL